jgi:hypothetical protein
MYYKYRLAFFSPLNMAGKVDMKVILRRVRLTTIAVENKCYIFSVCVCNLSYPSRKAHAPHYILIGTLSGSVVSSHIIF